MESDPTLVLFTGLAAIAVLIAVPAVAVYRENSELKMGRGPFALWVLLYLIVLPSIWNIAAHLVPGLATDAVLAVAGGCIAYVFYQRAVRRARDAGRGKRIAYIGVIPIANVVVYVILMLVPTARPGGTAKAGET